VPTLNTPLQGSKLPSIGQVLGRFLYLASLVHSSTVAARIVAEDVLPFWDRARIPTKRKQGIVNAIIKMYTNYISVKSNRSRTTAKQQANEKVSSIFLVY